MMLKKQKAIDQTHNTTVTGRGNATNTEQLTHVHNCPIPRFVALKSDILQGES